MVLLSLDKDSPILDGAVRQNPSYFKQVVAPGHIQIQDGDIRPQFPYLFKGSIAILSPKDNLQPIVDLQDLSKTPGENRVIVSKNNANILLPHKNF
jgi:hypothetical protein